MYKMFNYTVFTWEDGEWKELFQSDKLFIVRHHVDWINNVEGGDACYFGW